MSEPIESEKKIAMHPIPGQPHNIHITTQFNEQLSAFETRIDHDDGICGQEFLIAAATFLRHITMVYTNALVHSFEQQGQLDLAQFSIKVAEATNSMALALGAMAGTEPSDLTDMKDRLV